MADEIISNNTFTVKQIGDWRLDANGDIEKFAKVVNFGPRVPPVSSDDIMKLWDAYRPSGKNTIIFLIKKEILRKKKIPRKSPHPTNMCVYV